MPEKFDFSKIEDQEKFEKLPKEKRDVVIDEVRGETKEIKEFSEVTPPKI